MPSVFTLEGLSPQTLSLLGTPTDTSFWNTGQNFQPLDQLLDQQPTAMFTPGAPNGLRRAVANQPLGASAAEWGVRNRAPARMLGASMQPSNVPSNPNTVYYPINYGGPYAPHGTVIGPQRPPTYVYGPGGTPTVYTYQPPARGPIDVYANQQSNLVTFGGAQLGHHGSDDDNGSSNWFAAAIGVVLGASAVWLLNR